MFRLSSIQYLVFSNGVKMIPIHWRVGEEVVVIIYPVRVRAR